MASNTSNITEEVRKTAQQEISRVFSCLPGPSGLNFGSAGSSASSNKSNDTLTFEEFYAKREESRRGDFKPARKRLRPDKKSTTKATPKDVEVKVALAYRNDGMIKRSRGKVQIVRAKTTSSKEDILASAIQKHSRFDKTFDESRDYTLLYPDFSEVRCIPGTENQFTLNEYKEALGKEYKRLTFFIIPSYEIESSSDDDGGGDNDHGHDDSQSHPFKRKPTLSKSPGKAESDCNQAEWDHSQLTAQPNPVEILYPR
ncbi:uncharacterized protein LOC116615708 isoform X2 [Nematostella vectensis]|uniref:uncharacterized protein LOC116615708 isoform X2 n=1 Tax=Nematostella vectensis TaxID=45351 RepID=UPI002076F44A|nr:uncharacterized protein LOC116615708 isoform X2 [Nematostella vectensis]